MKYFILFLIKLYWFLKPKNSKPKCIFKKSCSNFVYEITKRKGFIIGLKAFVFRFKNCREYEVFEDPINKKISIILSSGKIIDYKKLSNRIINQKNENYEKILCK